MHCYHTRSVDLLHSWPGHSSLSAVITRSSAVFRKIFRILFVSHVVMLIEDKNPYTDAKFTIHSLYYRFLLKHEFSPIRLTKAHTLSYNLLYCEWILDASNTSLFLGTTRTISPSLLCSVSYWLDTRKSLRTKRERDGKANNTEAQLWERSIKYLNFCECFCVFVRVSCSINWSSTFPPDVEMWK